jgi:hypothetical protein
MTKTKKPPSETAPHVQISWGELIDKLTILEIKNERIRAVAAAANIRKELALLRAIAQPALDAYGLISNLSSRLRAVNETLWDVEEHIRAKEALGTFDQKFIELARSVYKLNDERGALKRQISLTLKSELMEEKSYK